ncbi:SRPBCC domain-containing protein [Robiginitalea sp. SC105]|uniref:SRPBCC family protein n=1 Tax=Robiginitalea sp. SC105 TaxID=2762332 RepID=UPI001639CB5B|nr:SRPBCC domain-containing protein [Robiginitalea sp. SC105]MBC2839816.1 SRPBCC domain-containing protein [Robiginitalea sp. SC105]
MKHSDDPIVVTETLDAPVHKVWEAITDPGQMREWYFENIPDFRAEVGFETGFDVMSGDRLFPHRWRVTEADPPNRITYHWSYASYPGEAYVTFELAPAGSGTQVRLINTVTADFPEDIPEFRRESCAGGWAYFIRERLRGYL